MKSKDAENRMSFTTKEQLEICKERGHHWKEVATMDGFPMQSCICGMIMHYYWWGTKLETGESFRKRMGL